MLPLLLTVIHLKNNYQMKLVIVCEFVCDKMEFGKTWQSLINTSPRKYGHLCNNSKIPN